MNTDNFKDNLRNNIDNNTAKKIQDDTDNIRSDMNKLAGRLSDLKSHSYDAFMELMDNWKHVMRDYKDRAMDHGKDGLECASSYVRRNPLQCILGTGLIVFLITKMSCKK